MFPHTITVFNQYNGQIKECIVNDVFFHVDKIVALEGRGENYTSTHQVIFSEEALKKYRVPSEYTGEENTFTLRENDIIIKGVREKYRVYYQNADVNFNGKICLYKDENDEETPSFSDLDNIENDHFSIKGIHDNDYSLNTYLTNIEVTD